MALNGNALGDAIKAAVDAVGNKTDRVAVYRAMGSAIVTYITANAQVGSTGTATGVTAGAAAVPVTATGTIT